MRHPLLHIRLGIPLFFISWIVLFGIFFFIGWYFEERELFVAFVNSLSFMLPLIVLAPCLWFVVRYTIWEEVGGLSFCLHHISAAFITILIWLSAAYLLRGMFIGEGLEDTYFIVPIHWQVVIAFSVYDYIIILYYLAIYYRNFKDKVTNEADLKNLVKEAELTALKSQINPHFLFNSLNSVSSLTITRPEQAREMVVKLSTFLRYSLAQDLKELNSLSNELSNIQLYLEIEKVRFGDRLQMKFDQSETCGTARIPNLILQPLYENAIKYGVHESLEPVTVHTSCVAEENVLKIQITNNYDSEAIPPKGNGIGLRNIQERLNLIYGRSDLMRIVKKENEFTVNLEFPQN